MTENDQFAGLAETLRGMGVSPDEIEAAQRQGRSELVSLFIDRIFVPGTQRLTRREVADLVGIDVDEAAAFWRALGFPDVSDDDEFFTEVDVDVLRRLLEVIKSGIVDRDMALQMTRVMGRSAAQVAAALIDIVRRESADSDTATELPQVLALGAPLLIDDVERWLVYVWRRHFAAEAKRAALLIRDQDEGSHAIVGFADLVGFSGISQSLDDKTLAAAVSKFEATAVDLVSRHSGRVIKMIGDEVMYEAPTAREGVKIGLDLVDAFASDEQLPDLRVGLAEGPATRNQGDIYGTAPNLASRLVDAAYPGTVLVSDSIHDELADDPDFNFRAVRPQFLKGFGRTKFWVLRKEGAQKPRPMWKVPLPLKAVEIADRVEEAVERVTRAGEETK